MKHNKDAIPYKEFKKKLRRNNELYNSRFKYKYNILIKYIGTPNTNSTNRYYNYQCNRINTFKIEFLRISYLKRRFS